MKHRFEVLNAHKVFRSNRRSESCQSNEKSACNSRGQRSNAKDIHGEWKDLFLYGIRKGERQTERTPSCT